MSTLLGMEPFDHLSRHSHHVVALFATEAAAESAAADLRRVGVPDQHLSMLILHGGETPPTGASQESAFDVAAGTVVGGTFGFVAGALAFGIPGVGTVIGAGLWTATAIGAAIGATAGIEVSDYHRAWEGQYRTAVANGDALVAVSTDDALTAAKASEVFTASSANDVRSFDRNGTTV